MSLERSIYAQLIDPMGNELLRAAGSIRLDPI